MLHKNLSVEIQAMSKQEMLCAYDFGIMQQLEYKVLVVRIYETLAQINASKFFSLHRNKLWQLSVTLYIEWDTLHLYFLLIALVSGNEKEINHELIHRN